MQDYYEIPEEKLSLSHRALRREFKKRKWGKILFQSTIGNSYTVATRPDGKIIKYYNAVAPNTPFAAGQSAWDKYISYLLLKEIGVKQAETILLKGEKDDDAELIDMIKRHSKIVVKPFNGSHGNDVFMNITDIADAKTAIETIRKHGGGGALAQEQLTSKNHEVRVICIDYKFVGAYSRVPAMVTGDGEHNVEELIDIENSTIRTPRYSSNLAFINKPAAMEYIKKKNIADFIPEKGEKVQVIGICNTGQGGTMEDVTDKFPTELKDLSEKIATHLNLPLIGIDYLDEYVIEVNESPALYHSNCAEKYVDYLEKIPA